MEGVLGRIILRKGRSAIGSLHAVPGWTDEPNLAGLLEAYSANCFENFRPSHINQAGGLLRTSS